MSTALYRKYRPDNFENIIGQSQVTDVLKNQIKEDNKILKEKLDKISE